MVAESSFVHHEGGATFSAERIDYDSLKAVNPRIIYIEKNGFGQWGRYAAENRPSNDGAAQALAGYAWISSFPNRPPLKHRAQP